ncbi:MAG: 50S ribosomal protein L23 [Candidatus Aenigmatarchaeota archaeon]
MAKQSQSKAAKPKAEAKIKAETAKPVTKTKDAWSIISYPHLTEKSMNMVELENKLVFIVSKDADKKEIKEAIESEFGVKVKWVKTEITTRGQKKAYIKISPEFSAADIASKLGMI